MRNIKFDRRSLLRGLGYGTVLCSGLSKSLYAQTLPGGRVARLAMFAYANGSHPDSNHMMATGETFTLTPHMAPLEPMKSSIVIVKRATLERGSGNSHKSTSFSVFGLGAPTSFDQTVADFVKSTTPIPSLEYSIGVTTGGGGVIPGLSQRNGSFLPGLRTPVSFYQKVAERVTGGAPPPPTTGNPTPPMTSPTGAEGALLRRKSLLDWVKGDVTTFRSRLGTEEQKKFDAYAESLRTLERDIGTNVPGGGGEPIKPSASCTKIAAPGTTFSTMTRVNDMPVQNKLYLDTIAMAFACNVTRVASAMWGGGQSDEPVRFADINMGNWHSTSHNDPKGGGGQQMIKVQAFMAGELLYFMNKLRTYADGAFSLLDNTIAVLSTQNGCSTQVAFAPMDHPKQNCPLIIGGGAAGAWKPGKVVDANGRNHNDAYLSIANAMGMKVTTVGNAAWCKGPLIT
jgi:Protein of unknown function (DUF1552)